MILKLSRTCSGSLVPSKTVKFNVGVGFADLEKSGCTDMDTWIILHGLDDFLDNGMTSEVEKTQRVKSRSFFTSFNAKPKAYSNCPLRSFFTFFFILFSIGLWYRGNMFCAFIWYDIWHMFGIFYNSVNL